MAKVAPKTVTAVGMTFISAMQTTRSMSTPFSWTAWTIGACGHLAVLGLLLERGGLVDLAPDDVAGDDHEALSRNGMRQPHDWNASGDM